MDEKTRFKSNNNVVYSCKYHIIWCPKYRKPVLVDDISVRLKKLILQKASEFKAEVIELEIMPDHVHLLVEIDPQFGIHRLIKSIKGYTSRIMRQEFSTLRTRIPTLWTNSYCVITIGGAPLAVIKQYIKNQKSV